MNNSGNLKVSPSPFRGFRWFLGCKFRKRPLLVNLEITKRCNAKCQFCSYWHDKSPREIEDYVPVVKKFKPLVLSITGGEPLIRKNYYEILKSVRPHCHYMVMITNGSLLTEDVAERLSSAGLNQLAVSLDYADEMHDNVRGIPGLYKKISDIIPRLTSKGYKILLNTIIMEANLDHIIPLVHKAKSWGAGISFSAYCSLKKSDDELMVSEDKFRQLEDVVAEIKSLKRSLQNIKNSDFYLNGMLKYFRVGEMNKCKAGKNWLQVTPDGLVKPCSELPVMCSFDEYRQKNVPKITCKNCWYTCRGESEAPHFAPGRLIELIRA